MDLTLEKEGTWYEPLKDENEIRTPRYKQNNSPRIIVHNGSGPRIHSKASPASSHNSVNTSTVRHNGIMSHSTPRHSAPSTIRSRHSNHMSSKQLLRHNSSVRSEKLLGANHWRPSTFENMRDECLKSGTLYEDPVFPAQDRSLYRHLRPYKNIKWKRPHEIVQKPTFVVKDVCNMDIEPGKLGDCCLISAFTCLAMAPKLLQKCIPSGQDFHDNYAGIFHFRFWRYGEWIDVVVDDRLPTIDGHILYMRSSDPQEFWPALFEKAYAKLYGSYESIHGGRIKWSLQDLTGGIAHSHSTTESIRHLLTVVDIAMSQASLIGAYISTSVTNNQPGVLSNGLKTGHTYRISGYAEIPVTGGTVILLRMRNPWHSVYWNGAWSRRSPHWNVLKQSTKEKMNIDKLLDGEFWISFIDFKNIFTEIEICHLGPESWKMEQSIQHRGVWLASVAHRQWRRGINAGGCVKPSVMCNNSQFYLELDKPNTVIISLMQKYKTTDDQRRYLPCSCLIYKVPHDVKTKMSAEFFLYNKIYASTKFIQDRENVHTFKLGEGSYMIMPVTEIEGQESRYMLRVYTAGNSIIRELDDLDGFKETQNGHSLDWENINMLRRQLMTTAIQNKYEEIDASRLQKVLATPIKDKIPLLCCFSESKIVKFKPINLSLDTCKAAITIFDSKIEGHLCYEDFNKLLSKLILWQGTFRSYSQGNLDFSSYSLRSALRLIGLTVSNKTLETLIIRFTSNGRVSPEQFICIVIKLSTVHARYNSCLSTNNILLSDLLHTAIYS
ncbi:calpain-9-like [Mytilus galloprovincialis]|uniref:calpain-9-like n=1 Tax=Mytilus galloprovincialis TaxID=29158 RepID=UPI003F7B73C6